MFTTIHHSPFSVRQVPQTQQQTQQNRVSREIEEAFFINKAGDAYVAKLSATLLYLPPSSLSWKRIIKTIFVCSSVSSTYVHLTVYIYVYMFIITINYLLLDCIMFCILLSFALLFFVHHRVKMSYQLIQRAMLFKLNSW